MEKKSGRNSHLFVHVLTAISIQRPTSQPMDWPIDILPRLNFSYAYTFSATFQSIRTWGKETGGERREGRGER